MDKTIRKIVSCFMVAVMLFSIISTNTIFMPTETVSAADQNAPTNLDLSKSGNAVTIRWNAVNGATGYNVYRSNSRYGTYSKINSQTITSTSYTDNTGGFCYYKVRTQFNGWESGDSDPISEEIKLFGNNVYIFDTADDPNQVQTLLSDTWKKQETNQFGNERYAFFFKPGTYSSTIQVKVGFYTQVSGLGVVPTDTTIQSLTCDATWLGGNDNHNATCNFWRMAENLNVNSSTLWAVSQAVSLRRMKINGNLYLHDNGGWASGGFLSDSVVTGSTQSGSQQQWLSRNCRWGSWTGQNWNMVFVGIADNNTPNEQWDGKITRVAQAPVVQEKPFLTYDNNAGYRVFVPERRTNAAGTSWENGVKGEYISIDDFYVAKPDVDTADTINAALNQGKHLLFTPGIYKINKAIEVKNPNTIVLGIGLASLQSTNGNTCIKVSDVDGVKIAGLLFDAGASNSPTLLQVGETASAKSHADNPIVVSDVFFRVGGFLQSNTASDTCIIINSNDVIGDNFWVWRADHGNYVGWNSNKTTNGIIVNGDNVTIYALMVEHFHQYQTVWNGNGGRTYFYQSEIPYDVPNQSSWMSGSTNGYASYKVADDVKSHEAYGLGIYLYNRDAAVKLNSVMEVPDTTGVKIHNICSVMLTGNPGIDHVINNSGSGCYSAGQRQYIIDYGTGVGAPSIVPGNECYAEAQNVVLTSTTAGATIKYTLDGSTPSRNNGITYNGPFKLSSSATVKAMAYKDGMTDSVVNTQEITIGDIAVGKPVTVSSTINPGTEVVKQEYTADKVVDGNKSLSNSRWESAWSDNQWLMVDLEKNYDLSEVKLTWEVAAAKAYTVEVSTDKTNWSTIATVTDGAQSAVLDIKPQTQTTARYIRMNATQRATAYGYSLYELEAYGTPSNGQSTEQPTEKPTETPTEEPTTGSSGNDSPKYISVGYLPNWSYQAYQTLDFDALTHLCIAFCNPDTSGNLSSGLSDSVMNAIVDKAHNSGVKVMASLGGAGYSNNYAALITPENCEAFCNKIIAYAQKYHLDGIDIDVEGDAPSSVWGNYENWIRTLREKCTANHLQLTTAVGQWYGDNITNTTLTYFDYVMLMEYDCSASSYSSRLNYWLNTKKVPASKIAIGVPFFGSGDKAYKDILAQYPDAWQNTNSGGITHDSMASMAEKANLAKNYAGIMIWELSQDTTGEHSLLKSIRDTLYDGKVAYRGDTLTADPIAIPGTVNVSKYTDKTASVTINTENGITYAGNLLNGSYLDYNIKVQEAGSYTLALKLAAGAEQYNAKNIIVKIDDETVATVPVQASSDWTTFIDHTATVSFAQAGTYKLSLVADRGACNIADFVVTKEEEKQPATIDINGYQISTTVEGFRTVYTVDDPSDEVESVGLVYGYAAFASEEDMLIGSTNPMVNDYAGTNKGLSSVSFGNTDTSSSYVMTMKFGVKSAEFFNAKLYVRAYAKLKDGNVIYSQVRAVSIYNIANYLYQNTKMNTLDAHEYLYNNILTTVDSSYKKVDFDWGNTIVQTN